MSQIIDVPGQGQVEFPDGMSDADIVAAIKRIQLGPKAPPAYADQSLPRAERYKAFIAETRKNEREMPDKVGGAVTDLAMRLKDAAPNYTIFQAITPEVASALGVGGRVAFEALPIIFSANVGRTVGQTAQQGLQQGGERVMQIALKPSKAARQNGDAITAVKTLLEEGANVSEGGVAKLTEKIDALDNELAQAIQGSQAKLLNTDVLQNLRGIMRKYAAGTLQAKNLDTIRDVANEFLQHPFFKGGNELPVQAAQLMKRQNYAELGDKAFGSGLRPQAERDALKALTSGLREGIERVAPETADINAKMSPLINARDLAQERTMAAANNNLGGIGLLNPKTLLLSLADRSPLAASLLARFLHNGLAPVAPGVGAATGGAAGIGALLQQQGQE